MIVNNKPILVIYIILLISFFGCKPKDKETIKIQEFQIENKQLDSLITIYASLYDRFNSKQEREDNYNLPIIIIDFQDGKMGVDFTYRERSMMSYSIFMNNFRVIGFIKTRYPFDVILLASSKMNYNELINLKKLGKYSSNLKEYGFLFLPRHEYQYNVFSEEYPNYYYTYDCGNILPIDKYSIFDTITPVATEINP